MQPAPILPNESERLAALRRYGILDIPAEADFDDFTRLASQICGTPIATITLVDAARQWFKSNIGLEANETPRDISFCGHAIAGNEILEVPNTLEDERFRDNPLVIGDPKVRFYAGAPLTTPDGLNIGALCVLDRTPHQLTPEQREMLTLLSHQVVHLLELRLAGRRIKWLNESLERLVSERTEELRESEERFRTLAEQGSEVFWFVGLNPERILYVSPAVERIWGLPTGRFYQDSRIWIASMHSDDQARVSHAYEAALSGQSARFEAEYRVIRPDGSMRWVMDSGTPIRNADGEIIRIGGMAKDITERKEVEAQLAEFAGELRRKNEALEEDLEMARELQNAMLPQQYPHFPATASEGESNVEFFHFYKSSMLVSGDFFDVFKISDTVAGVFICDVMGHGVRAALVAAMLRTLASESHEAWEKPNELLGQLNQMLCGRFRDSTTPIFASAFYLTADFGRGELHYANAGHPHPLRIQRSSRSANLHELNGIKPGPALGLFEAARYESCRCELRLHDVILLFTDGLFEVEGLEEQYFDYHNLLKAVDRLSGLPTRELCKGLVREVQQFSLSKEFTDDVCLVALEVNRISGGPGASAF